MRVKVTVEGLLYAKAKTIHGFYGEWYRGELDAEERTVMEYIQTQKHYEDGSTRFYSISEIFNETFHLIYINY